jgi:hypothetical protein
MEISKQAEVLLKALDTATEGRMKIGLESVRAVFLKAFPQWQGLADRRQRLRTLLDELASAERVYLPKDQRRGWEQSPAPALPRSVTLAREGAPAEAPFDHRSFPWVIELAFVASLRAVTNSHELRRIHDFLKNHPERRPIVPVKERAFQLFGDEKRLDDLRKTKLFDSGRLTLEILRCRDVSASLPCVPAPRPSSSTWLIVENEAAFDSFTRLNRVAAIHAGIILGSGRNVLRAVDFLSTLSASSTHRDFLYFGDIDRDGIAIPAHLDRRLYKHTGHHVIPAERYYDWLLTTFDVRGDSPTHAEPDGDIAWFPLPMHSRVQAALSSPRPLVQEAIGWEFLADRFSVTDDEV